MRTTRDQSSSDFLGSLKNLAKGFLAWASEEGAEGEHYRSAAGSMMVAPDGRVLFTRRAPGRDHAGSWAFPAGMSESEDADPQATALREAREEVGDEYGMDPRGMLPIDRRQTNGLDFHTYLMPVEGTFQPTLNDEHDGFQWSHLGDAPQPLHPGVAATIQDFAMDPLTEKGRKIMAAMKDQYGPERGERVFYASKNKGKIEGVDAVRHDPHTGQFTSGGGSVTLPSGHTVTRGPASPEGNKQYRVNEPYFAGKKGAPPSTHHIEHDPSGRVESHRITQPYKGKETVRDVPPARSEELFRSMHDAIRKAEIGGSKDAMIGDNDDLEDRFELTPGGLQIVDKKSGQLYDVDDAMRALTSRAKVLPDQKPATTPVAGKVQETKVTEPKPSFNVGKFETERVPKDAAPYGLGRFEATDAGTSEGARKAAATRKAHGGGSQAAGRQYWENKASGQKNNPYPHSVSTHQALRNKHSDTGARFAHMPEHQQIYTQGSRLHAAAAKALAARAPNARELSEKAHAYTNKVGQRYGFRE